MGIQQQNGLHDWIKNNNESRKACSPSISIAWDHHRCTVVQRCSCMYWVSRHTCQSYIPDLFVWRQLFVLNQESRHYTSKLYTVKVTQLSMLFEISFVHVFKTFRLWFQSESTRQRRLPRFLSCTSSRKKWHTLSAFESKSAFHGKHTRRWTESLKHWGLDMKARG